ncbi:MAG: hypothetical protein WC758_03730 [Candidatus Woesearchaeota archaeon]|jgi:hypothetical protein
MINTKLFANKKIILFLFILLLLVPSVLSLGIAPAYKTVILSSTSTTSTEYELRIMNENGVAQTLELSVVGDLSEYVILSKYKLEFVQGQTQQDIKVTISMPKGIDLKPGEYVSRILLKEKSSSQSGMMAVVGVASRVEMIVPGDGALLKSTLFAPNFKKNAPNAFSIEVKNLGGKDAKNCKAVIEILTPLNVNIGALTSESITILAGETKNILVPWSPSDIVGNYLAKSSILCDNGDTNDERAFLIGSADLRIVSFESDNFKLGGISKFDLIVASDWPEEIKYVNAQVDIIKNDVTIYTAKTENKDIQANGKVIFPVFLDTKNMVPDKYSVFVTLKYLDKEFEQVYNAYFKENEVIIDAPSGMVVGGNSLDTTKVDGLNNGNNSLLILAIIFILAVNGFLVYKLIKKKSKS